MENPSANNAYHFGFVTDKAEWLSYKMMSDMKAEFIIKFFRSEEYYQLTFIKS